MRVWYIKPEFLDQKRLYAAHNEIHTCLSCIKAGRRWGKFPTVYQHSLHILKEKHEKLVEEMAVRQHRKCEVLQVKTIISTHPSPFPLTFSEEETEIEISPTPEDFITDIRQLREKWESERYYYGLGTLDLRTLEEQYGITPGPTRQECLTLQNETLGILKRNPGWFKHYRAAHPGSPLRTRIQAFREGYLPPTPTEPLVRPTRPRRENIEAPALYAGPIRDHPIPPDAPDI